MAGAVAMSLSAAEMEVVSAEVFEVRVLWREVRAEDSCCRFARAEFKASRWEKRPWRVVVLRWMSDWRIA